MDEKQLEQENKRELRRKRRIRNQTIAYAVLIVLVILLAVGSVAAVKLYTERGPKETAQEQQSSESVTEEKPADKQESSQETLPAEESSEESQEVIEERTDLNEKLEELVAAQIQGMTLEDKVAGLFIVTPESITGVSTAVKAGDGTKTALEKYAVGGLIYFSKNIKNQNQFQEMVEKTKSYAKYPLFLAVDEEGGSVSRLGGAGLGTKVEDAMTVGQSGDFDYALQTGVSLGTNLVNMGLNLDFAPVADIVTEQDSVIGNRSYGSDPQKVGELVSAVAQGIQSVGVGSCVKHFPGMGSTKQDPHKGISTTDRTEEQFRAEEFVAFRTAVDSGVTMIMISNMAAPGLTGNNEPCVFSQKVVTDILRNEMGYDGIIITDAMNMAAVSQYYAADEAAIMALKAGCDMILMPEDYEKACKGVLEQIQNGTLSEERINDALSRIYRVKLANMVQ